MIARLQAGAALVLALGLHVGAFAIGPDTAGMVSSGASGTDLVSLEAVSDSLADLVREWDRPPTLPDDAPPDQPLPTVVDAPTLGAATDTAPVAAMTALPPLRPMADIAPQAEVSVPIPAPAAEPVPATRPKPRPKATDDAAPKPAGKTRDRARKPKPASAGQAAQEAAGSGNGASAGNSGTAGAATLSKAVVNDLKAGWGAAIRARIERRKRYPIGAKGASGTVTLRLTVARSGALAGVSVARSSGHPALDQAAVAAVRAAGGFPAAPKGLEKASYSFTLPMAFAR